MANCLVTKLKGVVYNENLPKLGEFIINVINLNSSRNEINLSAVETKSITVRVIDGTNRLKCPDLGYNDFVNNIIIPKKYSSTNHYRFKCLL